MRSASHHPRNIQQLTDAVELLSLRNQAVIISSVVGEGFSEPTSVT